MPPDRLCDRYETGDGRLILRAEPSKMGGYRLALPFAPVNRKWACLLLPFQARAELNIVDVANLFRFLLNSKKRFGELTK
jgi:hypothetical protein